MNTPIKAIIVDDELIACDNLKWIIEHFIKEPVHVAGMAGNTSEAEHLIKQTQPDLVFLDIEMPDENGFHFLERMAPFTFEVIFTTAYDAFAIKAFRINALDYILKPIDIDDLENALVKARQKIGYNQLLSQQSTRKDEGADLLKQDMDKLFLRNGNNVEIVELSRIVYIEANLSYTHIFFLKEQAVKHITMSTSIARYEAGLPKNNFFRIHKSYIVNLLYFDKIIKGTNAVLLLKQGIKLPVGRRRYADLISFLKERQMDV